MTKEKEIEKIKIKLQPLIDGNWANSQIGQIEELKEEINLIGDLLLFIIATMIHKKDIDINFLKEEYKDGWKIDYK